MLIPSKKYLIPVFVLLFIGIPFLAGAQDCYTLSAAGYDNTANLCFLIEDITGILYVLGLGLGVLAIIVGGIAYITSAGDQSRTDKAKKIITYGLIGAAIILLSSFIVDLLYEVIVNQLT